MGREKIPTVETHLKEIPGGRRPTETAEGVVCSHAICVAPAIEELREMVCLITEIGLAGRWKWCLILVLVMGMEQ